MVMKYEPNIFICLFILEPMSSSALTTKTA